MKNTISILFVGLIIVSTGLKAPEKPKSFALVELFTAEGCSSCPPADDLLKEMTGILHNEGKEVLSLAFHVTYWNRGWEDPYSNEAYTDRQKKYNAVLSPQQLYTPQAVVNGGVQFIGSNPFAFRNECLAAIAKTPLLDIQGTAKIENDSLIVSYGSNKAPSKYVINIALVETSVDHFIPQGENKSKTLHHYNVVRAFSSGELKLTGRAALSYPKGLLPANSSVILYAQQAKSLKITGARQVSIQ